VGEKYPADIADLNRWFKQIFFCHICELICVICGKKIHPADIADLKR